MRLFLRDPKEEVRLKPGQTYEVRPGRPHLVTNFHVIQRGDAFSVTLAGQSEWEARVIAPPPRKTSRF